MTPSPQPGGATVNHSADSTRTPPRRVRSEALLGSGRRLIIDHGGASYVLLLTRNGKLILTK